MKLKNKLKDNIYRSNIQRWGKHQAFILSSNFLGRDEWDEKYLNNSN